jgi:hypothetical protein
MPPTAPSQGPGNGGAARQPRGGMASRPARQYRPGRGRHVENTIMSALVRAGLVPRSYLLTTRGRKTGRPRTNPRGPGGTRWAALAGRPLRGRVLGTQRARERAGDLDPPGRHPRVRHPRGSPCNSRTHPQAIRAPRPCHTTVFPGDSGFPSGGLHHRGRPPPRIRAHASPVTIARLATLNAGGGSVARCGTRRDFADTLEYAHVRLLSFAVRPECISTIYVRAGVLAVFAIRLGSALLK